ncbi:hypothetical protein K492DRAFT_220719 [Lichtheimia hyalospora FSU 10163]|nr:hypothetical protein K492DRAFT_220719 [Lichtheimia hyalospora FSU 10163]
MSVIVTLGNTTITSGKLFAFFLAQLLGAPLNSDFYALFTLEQYCDNLFSLVDASSEVVIITMIYAQRYVDAVGVAGANQLFSCNLNNQLVFITVACRLAFKWHDDRHMGWAGVEWDMASGLDLDVIDEFEWVFAEAVGFTLFVSSIEFNNFALGLQFLLSPLLPPHVTLALPSSLSSPSPVAVKAEPDDGFMPSIKQEPVSPTLPYMPVKVEELYDNGAALAALMVKNEDDSRGMSMPLATTTNTNISSLRFSV